jgi:hypothetical protein
MDHGSFDEPQMLEKCREMLKMIAAVSVESAMDANVNNMAVVANREFSCLLIQDDCVGNTIQTKYTWSEDGPRPSFPANNTYVNDLDFLSDTTSIYIQCRFEPGDFAIQNRRHSKRVAAKKPRHSEKDDYDRLNAVFIVTEVAVHPDLRGKGIFEELLCELESAIVLANADDTKPAIKAMAIDSVVNMRLLNWFKRSRKWSISKIAHGGYYTAHDVFKVL